MAKYKTADGVTVDATQDGDIWSVKFPDGETRLVHAAAFGDHFKKVPAAKKASK